MEDTVRSTLLLTDENEPILQETVAGLPLRERIRRASERAGFQQVAYLTNLEPGQEQPAASSDHLYALLKPGYLPDTGFLEALQAVPPGQFLVGEAALVHRSCNPDSFLQQLSKHSARPDLFALLQSEFPTQSMEPGGGRLYPLKNREDISAVEDHLFQSLLKNTEGFMEKHLERKISLALSRRLAFTSITPNQMTVLSLCVGLVGAGLMAIPAYPWAVVGSLLFIAHAILDGCDGELARIKFLQSRFGGLLDYWGDNVVHSAVFLAIAVAWSQKQPGPLPYALAGLAIFGGLASAGWIYFLTMHNKSGDDPLYTSVSNAKEKSRLTKVADMLSRRDFIYLVAVLAFFGKLHWFLVMSAIGAPVFFLALLWIHFTEKPPRQPGQAV